MEKIIHKYSRVMTPTELIVNNICKSADIREDVFKEIEDELRKNGSNPQDKFDFCLKALKRRGLIVY